MFKHTWHKISFESDMKVFYLIFENLIKILMANLWIYCKFLYLKPRLKPYKIVSDIMYLHKLTATSSYPELFSLYLVSIFVLVSNICTIVTGSWSVA